MKHNGYTNTSSHYMLRMYIKCSHFSIALINTYSQIFKNVGFQIDISPLPVELRSPLLLRRIIDSNDVIASLRLPSCPPFSPPPPVA